MIKDANKLLSQEINKFEGKHNKILTVVSEYSSSYTNGVNYIDYSIHVFNKQRNLISDIFVKSDCISNPNTNDISSFVNNFVVLFNPLPRVNEFGTIYNLRIGKILQDSLIIAEGVTFKCPKQLPKFQSDPKEGDLIVITYYFAFNLQRKLNDLVNKVTSKHQHIQERQ